MSAISESVWRRFERAQIARERSVRMFRGIIRHANDAEPRLMEKDETTGEWLPKINKYEHNDVGGFDRV